MEDKKNGIYTKHISLTKTQQWTERLFRPRWNALSIISSPNKTTAVICRVRGPLTSSIVGRTVLGASVLTRTRAGPERREEDQQRRSWAVCVRDGSPGILRPTNNGHRPLVSLAKQIIGNFIACPRHCCDGYYQLTRSGLNLKGRLLRNRLVQKDVLSCWFLRWMPLYNGKEGPLRISKSDVGFFLK